MRSVAANGYGYVSLSRGPTVAKGKAKPRERVQARLVAGFEYLHLCRWVECPLAITDTAVPPVGRGGPKLVFDAEVAVDLSPREVSP